MKKIFYLLLILSLLLMPLLEEAAAQPGSINKIVIDQMHLKDDEPGTLWWAIGGGSDQALGQTITASLSGDLIGMFMPIDCTDGTLMFQIRNIVNDETGDTVLYEFEIDASELQKLVVGKSYYRLFPIILPPSRPLYFEAGERFAVVLDNYTGSCGIHKSIVENYEGGDGYCRSPSDDHWIPLSLGGNPPDLPFMTLMLVP